MQENPFEKYHRYTQINTRKKILANRARCRTCLDVVESKHRYDLVYCSCGDLAVAGGHDYLRRHGGLNDWDELSEYEQYG